MHIIEIKGLTKYYGKSRGIDGVSFNVDEGEIFGFIGPNGAGKSTTIRLLLGLIFPTGGTAAIFGKNCFTDGPVIRQHIGYLPSEVFYYDKMKVIDLLKYSASFYKNDSSQRMYELAEIMGLDLNRRIEDLSYGNKKKVGIVQGLLHEPRLIILDEPTSGLDPLMQQKFFDLIAQENKKGATVLFSSHILSEVQQLCDRVAIIKEGKIIKLETIKALRAENYKKVHIKKSTDTNNDQPLRPLLEKTGFITEFQEKEHDCHFFYKGNINEIIQVLGQIRIQDVLIEEPTLEEIFMHYYQ